MILILHPADCPLAAGDRLKRLSVRSQTFLGTAIQELSHSTPNKVYLIPLQVIESDCWPRMRVELARANRLYIVYLENATTLDVARCMRGGAFDVLSQEDSDERWSQAMSAVAENQKIWMGLYGGRPLSEGEVLLGSSQPIERLRQTINRLGPTDVHVLILGESGVGKERVASALHQSGGTGPFIALNCASIPKDLLEAELFGVEKGAFTGAHKSRPGLVEQANGGTLFLDEVGEMELFVQPKLLRFLETRRARRVGGSAEYSVNTRVVSATNRNLELEITDNRFRSDLYYRLAELILHVPPLRTRPEDIPSLAPEFLSQANERFGKNFESFEPALISRFQHYDWPGNVREFKSAIDRMVLLFDGPLLRASWWDPPESRFPTTPTAQAAPAPAAGAAPLPAGLPGPLNTRQKLEAAKRLLSESANNYSWVAGQLGINPSTLWRWRRSGKLD